MTDTNTAGAPADDQVGCARLTIGERITNLEARLTSLELTIGHRIEQEAILQDRTRELTVAQVATEIKSELKSLENAMRAHISDQKDDDDKHHDSIRRLHARLDALLQKNERSFSAEFGAVHGRIDHVEKAMIPELRKDIAALGAEFREAIKPLERITYMRLGAAGAAGGIATAVLWALLQLGVAYIKARYGAN